MKMVIYFSAAVITLHARYYPPVMKYKLTGNSTGKNHSSLHTNQSHCGHRLPAINMGCRYNHTLKNQD